MAKQNAFDSLLASINDDSDRQAITGLADKYPNLRDSVMMRSDYSRNMDELKAERERLKAEADYAAAMKKWREENWVENAYGDGRGALKRELEKDAEIQQLKGSIGELEQQIQVGGEVNFEDLGKYLADKGYASQDTVKSMLDTRLAGEKQTVEQYLAGNSVLALKTPRLVIRHYKNFQEELDTDGLVEFANKNGMHDLEKAYDAFTADKRAELDAKKHAEEIETAKRQVREEVEKELAAKSPARMPGDDGDPEMGHFQRKILGIPDNPEGTPQEDIPFGRGALAHKAAREWNASSE